MELKVLNGKCVDKTTERDFETIVIYMGNPRLLLAPMFLCYPLFVRYVCLVNPRDLRAERERTKVLPSGEFGTKLITKKFFLQKIKMILHLGKVRFKKLLKTTWNPWLLLRE